MTLEIIFITQIVSVIGFVIALFVLYRVLVSAKDATIETLRQQLKLSEQKISGFENQEPDILIQILKRRTKALENELREHEKNILNDKEKNIERIKSIEKEIKINEEALKESVKVIENNRAISAATRQHLIKLYDGSCQVCGLKNCSIMQTAHVKPYSKGGKSSISNMLLLCPNDHSLFDRGLIGIDANLDLIGISGHLNISQEHEISKDLFKWHRDNVLNLKQSPNN